MTLEDQSTREKWPFLGGFGGMFWWCLLFVLGWFWMVGFGGVFVCGFRCFLFVFGW